MKLKQAKSLSPYKHIRFIGAGGIGMSALVKVIEGQKALANLDSGLKISKYDKAWIQNDQGSPQNSDFTDDIDLAVVSTAIPQDDTELLALKKKSVEIWHRSDMLLALSAAQEQKSIVVTGTHGKTSCSSMLAHLLSDQKMDPSFVVGGMMLGYETNGHAGTGEYFVLEGDESDKSFMKTNPHIALITSIEADHLENYSGGLEEINKCFSDFACGTDKLVICLDSPNSETVLDNINGPEILTYSNQNPQADLFIDAERNVFFKNEIQGQLKLKSFGDYNYLNALGVLAAASFAGVAIPNGIKSLENFKGTRRRLEFIGDYDLSSKKISDKKSDVAIYDDYAHHPTEIKALLKAAIQEVDSGKYQRLVFVYQPHHPLRTRDFWDDFVAAFKVFSGDNIALLADVYVARSGHIEGINSKRMVEDIANANVSYLHFADAKFDSHNEDEYFQLKTKIEKELKAGDLLLLVGAGNITKVAAAFKA